MNAMEHGNEDRADHSAHIRVITSVPMAAGSVGLGYYGGGTARAREPFSNAGSRPL